MSLFSLQGDSAARQVRWEPGTLSFQSQAPEISFLKKKAILCTSAVYRWHGILPTAWLALRQQSTGMNWHTTTRHANIWQLPYLCFLASCLIDPLGKFIADLC